MSIEKNIDCIRIGRRVTLYNDYQISKGCDTFDLLVCDKDVYNRLSKKELIACIIRYERAKSRKNIKYGM